MDCPKTESGEVAVARLPDDSVSQGSDMDCPKTETGEVAVACLPDDSVVDILSRLPTKPLFRFKCVSKDWCGLITDRLGCRKFPKTLEGFFGGEEIESSGGFIDLSGRRVPLFDPSFSFLMKLPEIEDIFLLDSCNGLVLLGHRRVPGIYDTLEVLLGHRRVYDMLGYIVCNPTTEEWVSGSCDTGSDDEDNEYYDRDTYLIFDPAISPHFHLIQLKVESMVDVEEVHTFSSETGEWRLRHEGMHTGESVGVSQHTMVSIGSFRFNRLLQWAQFENQHMIHATGGERSSFRTSPFRNIDWPQNDRGVLIFVAQSQGHLYCLSGCTTEISQMTELSIWVLEDYNPEKWVLRDNVSLSHLFKRTSGCFINDWNVVSIHPDRGLVFFAENWNCKLISYDMDKKEVRAICSLHACRQLIIPYVPYFTQSTTLAKKG